jgi:ABC-type dipeptide/oligopeptide/nickel transport system ATPase component
MNTTENHPQSAPLVEIQDLCITFGKLDNQNEAVKGIQLKIHQGETVAVVGESGSGKSVTSLALTRLLPEGNQCQITGRIQLEGKNVLEMNDSELRKIRGGKIAYIFQEPSTSLNPVYTIGYQIKEALELHRPEIRDQQAEAERLLDAVGIKKPKQTLSDYPHQLSGGMQQRAMIAMALACQPKLLVADEPTTALDVTIQAQIIDLLKKLKKEQDMSIMLITHNFGIVTGFADRVIVMFRGEIVEEGATEDVLKNPQHPYTKALIDCIPKLGKKQQRLTTIDYDKITGT